MDSCSFFVATNAQVQKLWCGVRSAALVGATAAAIYLAPTDQLRADTLVDGCVPSVPDLNLDGVDPANASKTLRTAAAAIEKAISGIPDDAHDTLAVLLNGDLEPGTLAAWVGSEIALAPYRGTLRGARGTILTREGNSLDRALLLSELLSGAGYDVRLARRQLTTDQARALLSPPAAPTRTDLGLPTTDFADFGVLGFDSAQLAATRDAMTKQDAACRAAAQDRIDAQVRVLAEKLAMGPTEADSDAAIAALMDHWWVQATLGDGVWVDADPSAGILAAAAPEETYAIADLPDNLKHGFKLELVVEFTSVDGKRRTEPLLTHAAPTADTAFRPLILSNQPLPAPVVPGYGEDDGASAEYLDKVINSSGWVPVLIANGGLIEGATFSMDGAVETANEKSAAALRQAGPRKLAEGAGGLLSGGGLGGGIGGGQKKNAPVEEVLSGLWLNITTTAPDQAARSHQRMIYDAYGPAARANDGAPQIDPAARGRSMLFQIDIAVTAGSPTPEAALALQGRNDALLFRGLAQILDGAKPAPHPTLSSAIGYGAMRGGYRGAPDGATGVTMFWREVQRDKAGALIAAFSVDIVENDTSVASAGHLARLRAGVAETVLETLIFEGPKTGGNTALAFARNGETWSLLKPGDVAPAELPADLRTRIAKELSAGLWVVAPKATGPAPDALAYWRIDPRSGATLGINAFGRGGSPMAEYVEVNWMLAVNVFFDVGVCLLLEEGEYISNESALGCLVGAVFLSKAGMLKMGKKISSKAYKAADLADLDAYIKVFQWLGRGIWGWFAVPDAKKKWLKDVIFD